MISFCFGVFCLSELIDVLMFFLLLFFFLCIITGGTPTHTTYLSSTEREKDRDSAGRKRRSRDKFQPPDQPPACKDWVPDTQHHVCMVCQRERFTMVSVQTHTTNRTFCSSLNKSNVYLSFIRFEVQQTSSLSEMRPPRVSRLF